MTKRFIVHMHVGYAGMDGYEILIVRDNATEDEIQLEAWHMALEHAERYGYYAPSEDDVGVKISYNIEGYAEIYDPEKHDRHRNGGGSFETVLKKREK